MDVTPAMLERARAVAAEAGVTNVDWRLGDVTSLPWPDATFSLVVSRFAFHHFQEPGAVLAEMRRVCRPGGRVVVADLTASPDPAKAEAFHRMEILRDPSHARALTKVQLEVLFTAAGLPVRAERLYGLKVDLDGVMSRSFPKPEDVPVIRRMFEDAVADDGLGLDLRKVGDNIRFTYPVVILVGTR